MEKPIEAYWKLRLEAVKASLQANQFEATIVDTPAEAADLVMERMLPQSGARSVSFGGSMTVVASGLYEALKKRRDLEIVDTYQRDVPPEEFALRRRKSLLVDLFITGTNAVAENGTLVNLDMIGNRVAGITFGPGQVVLLVGRNKIVPDVAAAMARIQNYAAPANAMRLDKKTPCAKTGRCQDCNSPERICNSWVITRKSFPKGRIKIVLINEDLGL